MLELVGWNVGMSLGGVLIVLLGAVILGALIQMIGRTTIGYEWIVTSAAVLAGAWLGSESFGALSTWGPLMEGVYLLPAMIGGLVLGAAMDAATRYVSGGSYLEPRPI